VKREYDLEERLLDYSVGIIDVVEGLMPGLAAAHIGGQMLRSGTSPLFNHGEAQAAESARDFVHKMKVCLKELRETRRALRLIRKKPLTKQIAAVDAMINETEELIRIFFTSIRTANRNTLKEEPDFEYGSGHEPEAIDETQKQE
jgi:four helix bundle protein